MAFAKIQKQFNIANQLITEKVFNGEKSRFNDEFNEMEKRTDATAELIDDLQQKTKEFLQPNPAARAKMAALKISSSQAKTQYPQTEGILGQAMTAHGKKIGEESGLGQALTEAGDALKQIADVKYSLDNNVKQNFLDPLNHLQNNDLKEVLHHRKKLSTRRLDYDGKRRKMQKNGGITEDEVRVAQEKFNESLHNASTSMYHLLENDVELISQLCVFSESLMQYYQSCAEIMQTLTNKLYDTKNEAMHRPKKEFIPTSLSDLNIDAISLGSNSDRHNNNSNGARNNSVGGLSNLSRSKATSSFNLASHNNHHQNKKAPLSRADSNFSRSSKLYGSQSNISSASSVNNYQINSPTSSPLDRWEKAWEENNNNYRPESFQQHQQQQQHSFPSSKHSVSQSKSFSSFSQNSSTTTSNRSQNHYVDDPFDDPWSVKPTISNPIPMSTTTQPQQNTVNLINNFNNNFRSQSSSALPHCVALFDFEAENPGELSFKENDVIRLVSKVDENWYEGQINGRVGYFPQSYVSVKIPLPLSG